MGYLVTVTAPAERDLQDIFLWSETEFGSAAADRYEVLIAQALTVIGENLYRPGAKHRQELLLGIYTYHLATSRDQISENRVKSPRHFLVYRVIADRIEILRVLHDSRIWNVIFPATEAAKSGPHRLAAKRRRT